MQDQALGVEALIEQEDSRWVVYLLVSFWDAGATSNPIHTLRRRITDYATREQAEMAARWMKRSADRELRLPPP